MYVDMEPSVVSKKSRIGNFKKNWLKSYGLHCVVWIVTNPQQQLIDINNQKFIRPKTDKLSNSLSLPRATDPSHMGQSAAKVPGNYENTLIIGSNAGCNIVI